MSTYKERMAPHLSHAMAPKSNKTVGEILESMTEEQRNVVNYLVYKALGFSEQAQKDKKKE